MEKNILIAADGSNHSKAALSYVAGLAERGSEFNFTLIHIQPMISMYLLEEARKNVNANETLRQVIEHNRTQSHQMLSEFKDILLRKGISERCVEVVSQTRMMGMARDIIEYAFKNLFDAVVVGRRGLTRVQQFFMGSISAKLVEHCNETSVWVIDESERLERVLVAIDGIDSGLRMTDYLGRMLGGIPGIFLTFYHVPHNINDLHIESSAAISSQAEALVSISTRQIMDTFWPQALERLTQAGIDKKNLEIITAKRGVKAGKMIAQQVEQGDYDTLVLGRRGQDRAYYLGSISMYVTERVHGRAVWIVA